jgi:5'-3' exoribonuclease 2
MGVPAFYRWLSEKYPKIVQDILEERVHLHPNGSRIPYDWSKPNPSGLECDNLYIDMNGIIHPCSHPEVGPQPTSEEEMFDNVCRYVDRLVRVMRPRQMLYLAIDGVAPRAKMNQQRARRFRAAQEARENQELEETIRQELIKTGQNIPPSKKAWDSNVITPGTTFMLRLSEFLRFYIRKRLTEDKNWRHLRVVFSDASIPGEGEHKIMAHVRLQRSQAGYDPNLVHVMHGLDADLIMLALATHEAHFYISRELVLFGRRSQEQLEQRQLESGFRDAQRRFDEEAGTAAMELEENQGKPLQRVSIPILREYLINEFAECLVTGKLPFGTNLERIIDDFVFLCFFVGNDFLPHLPSLDIRDGALDYLLNVYKRILPSLGDYITNHGGTVNLTQVDVILAEVGSIEDHVFEMKHQNEERTKEQVRLSRERNKMNGRSHSKDPPPDYSRSDEKHKIVGRAARVLAANEQKSIENQKAALAMRKSLAGLNSLQQDDLPVANAGEKRKIDQSSLEQETKYNEDEENEFEAVEDDEDDIELKLPEIKEIDPKVAEAFKLKVKEEQQKKLDKYSESVQDNVRLHEAGWKDRYYSDKCKADDVTKNGGREHLFRSYVIGLCWVMKYYYDGCPSWKWFYPFHYAPFASDLRNVERFYKDVKALELDEPFKPVEQLMAVLPEESSHAIPKAARWLMSDSESPILDFYPKEVLVDPNGKAMPWLWVVLLPFIDERRLLTALHPTMKKWTSEELLCNARGLDDGYVYVHKTHGLVKKVGEVYDDQEKYKKTKFRIMGITSVGVKGFTGSVRLPLSNDAYKIDENLRIERPARAVEIKRVTHDNLFAEDLESSDILCVAFTEPAKLSHKSNMLPGARPPIAVLKPEDKRIQRPRLNRGGGTIANLGVSNGKSHQQGYGSMNISQYERDLADRNGRNHQMYQPGTRPWGAAEPTPKRHREQGHPQVSIQLNAPYHSNPFNRPPAPQPPPPAYPQWQQRSHASIPYQQHLHQHQGVATVSQQFDNSGGLSNQPLVSQYPAGYPSGYNQQRNVNQINSQHQQQHQSQQNRGFSNSAGQVQQSRNRQPYSAQHHRQQQQQQHQQQSHRTGESFQHLNRSAPPGPPPPLQSQVISQSVISSLRSQLVSTLQQHKQSRPNNKP